MMNLLLSSALAALLPAAPTPCGGPKLEQMTRDAEVVFVGEVREVEEPSLMQSWSGLILFRQHVRYEVKAVLKGKLSEKELWVGYPIYYESLLADRETPQLSPEVFKTASAHLVFIKHIKEPTPPLKSPPEAPPAEKRQVISPYGPVDVNCGALASTPAAEEEIRRLVSKP
jgi:hypothetical protein